MDDNVAVKGVRLVTLLVQNNEMSQEQARSPHPFACSRDRCTAYIVVIIRTRACGSPAVMVQQRQCEVCAAAQ